MTICSRYLELDNVVPGMTVSKDLQDGQGNTLLPRGAPVTESILNALRRRGVETVPVFCEAVAEPHVDERAEAERERMRQRLAVLFRRCGTDGANGIVLKYITWHRLGKNA